uniref:Phosphatidylinositol-specific phospholipase C X domain-containing protein n=1 Tax=Pundamilia nyererei TaxID=303518 RepID=A0A3B4H3D2_9CICH
MFFLALPAENLADLSSVSLKSLRKLEIQPSVQHGGVSVVVWFWCFNIHSLSWLQLSVLSDQCDLGVRFLDLRIARKPAGSSKLFFAHGIYTLITVKEALDELAGWLDAHPKEIVIIACSHFESLSDEDHAHLMEFILLLFRGKLCPPQETPTLRSCWSKGQQVIVSYDDQELQHPGLWNRIPYWYANSPDPKKVITYLEGQQRQGRPDGFYVTGLNLTETMFYVFLHPFQSMRMLTLNSLSLLLQWAGEQQPGPEGVNIMCCDFVGMIIHPPKTNI